MSETTNYARRGGDRRTGKPLEVRFFSPTDEIPRDLRDGWVWWRVPRGYIEVTLVGETQDDRLARMRARGA